MKFKYVKWHNNYDELRLGSAYEGFVYKKGWLKIGDALYRQDCFDCLETSIRR